MKTNPCAFLIPIALTLLATKPLTAQTTYSWINPLGGWYDSGNWSPSGPPTSIDKALFNLNAIYDVKWDNLTGNRNLKLFELDRGTANLVNFYNVSTAYSLTVHGSGGSGQLTDFHIHTEGAWNPKVTIRGLHVISQGGAWIGPNSSGTYGNHYPTLLVDGAMAAGSQFTVAGSVGLRIDGRLELASGGDVNSTSTSIGGNHLGGGLLSVDTGSTFTNSADLNIGVNGTGTASITTGGSVSSLITYVGSYGGDSGILNINGSGSSLNSTAFRVGELGTGLVNLNSNALLAIDNGSIGEGAGSFGTVNLQNNSTWTANSNITIGVNGNGTLNVFSGSDVSNSAGFMGGLSGGTGVVNVSGSGSSWIMTGGLQNGVFGGNGTLNIESGGLVSAGGFTRVGGNYSTVTVTGAGSTFTNSQSLIIGQNGTGTVTVSSGGSMSSQTIYMGWQPGDSGNMNIYSGGSVSSSNAYLGYAPSSGNVGSSVVNVSGSGSSWILSGSLDVGNSGPGSLNIGIGGLVDVGGTTTIGSNGFVNLNGGTLDFGQTDGSSFVRINANSGTLRGSVNHSQYTNVASLSALTYTSVNSNQVVLSNSGTLYGQASLGSSLVNQSSGEVEILAGERMRFGSTGASTNAGEINNYGGIIRFDGAVTNQTTGFVAGRGQFIANGGWTNQGTMAFSGGNADILGDVSNPSGGLIVTSGGSATTTFFDDVVNNGIIRTSQNADSVFLGSVSGSGSFTGTGTVYFEGDLRPGNSPGIVTFGGDVVLADNAISYFEFGGKTPGEYDQLQIAGDVFLNNSTLNVSMLKGFSFGTYQKYLIAAVDGTVNGQFGTYGEGAQLGNSNLFITYAGFGTVKGIGLFTKDLPVMWGEYSFGPGEVSSVPEASSLALLGWIAIGVVAHRQRRASCLKRVNPAVVVDLTRVGVGPSFSIMLAFTAELIPARRCDLANADFSSNQARPLSIQVLPSK